MQYLVKPDEIKHVIHALAKDFFDSSCLEGRTVIGEYGLSYTQQRQFPHIKEDGSLGQTVFIEEADGSKSKSGFVQTTGVVFNNINDNERYHGATGVVAYNQSKNKIDFSNVDDQGKLVVLENGDVVGVILNNGVMKREDQEYPMTLLVPAVSFIVPPTKNIKHYARDNFNLEAILKGRKVLDGNLTRYSDKLVYLEGSDPSVHFELDHRQDSFYSGKQKYDGAWLVRSWIDSKESDLDALYERNALMTTPDSIGKALLLLGNPYESDKLVEEIVAGIVVEHKAEYNEYHGRWYAKTKVCPANYFTLKG